VSQHTGLETAVRRAAETLRDIPPNLSRHDVLQQARDAGRELELALELSKPDSALKPAQPAPKLAVKQLVESGMVIQIDPDKSDWGPLLCIVTKASRRGLVHCHVLVPDPTGKAETQAMMLNVEHGDYAIIGKAIWEALAVTTRAE
jgi:hypothetical protein